MAAGRTVSLVDVGYVVNSTAGFDFQRSLERLAADCDLLWQRGVFSKPYFRLDFSPNLTLSPGSEYNRAAEQVMQWWTSAERAELTLICGNEPNMGTIVSPSDCARVVSDTVTIRDLLGYPVRVFAPAIAPWNANNVPTTQDCWNNHPRGMSTEWENWQWALQRRLRGVNYDGLAMHLYGRPMHIFDREEAHRTRPFDERGASNGFAWYKDALVAGLYAGENRPLPIAVTEVNTFTDRPSSESYPYGWLTEARAELEKNDLFESLNVFVGEPHGEEWAKESTKLRIGQCAAMDDDFNKELMR